MVSLPNFVLCLISFVSLLQVAHSRPWFIPTVELSLCSSESTAISPPSECASLCEPVRVAQETCQGDSPCTCSAAPPSVVDSCLECHIGRRDGLQPQWVASLSQARASYAQLCNDLVLTITVAIPPPSSPSPSSSNSSSTVTPSPSHSRRESTIADDSCVYGLPVITWKFPENAEISPYLTDRNLFMSMFFIIAVAICIIQNQRRS
ncbi:hypothetical protein BDW22DRAFT_1430344 [Trametopsis cervina]|nr:hypothetical protein BDW22DRAFT_1430344 [Trametopsis cervina]